MQSPKKDMAGVISFYPSERPDLVRQLSRLPSYSKDELRSNYHRVDWTQYEVISVYENNGIVQGFSVAWHRSKYNGTYTTINNVYACLSRLAVGNIKRVLNYET